jgi:hypothetical protein
MHWSYVLLIMRGCIAIRRAVGAGRGRLIQQLLIEGACLAALAGAGLCEFSPAPIHIQYTSYRRKTPTVFWMKSLKSRDFYRGSRSRLVTDFASNSRRADRKS